MSSRWTIPGARPRRRRAGRRARRPASRRGGRAPAWTTRPGRLVDHREALVDVDEPRLGAHGGAGCAPAPARARRARSRPRPAVIATSARLNAGHSGGSMKSVTAPSRIRSARLPSAPPASRPTPSHSPGRVGVEREPAERSAPGRPPVNGEHQRVAPLVEEPEGDPAVGHPGELEAEREVACARRARASATTAAFATWSSDDDEAADREHPRPGASAGGAHPRIRLTTSPPTIEEHDDRDDRADVERADPRHPGAGTGSGTGSCSPR